MRRLGGLHSPSALLLVLVNLIPLAGVVLFGWSVGALMLLYWMETVVIGVLNVPKILTAGMDSSGGGWRRGGPVFIAAFFIVHFGGFNVGHFSFLRAFFDLPRVDTALMVSLGGLALSHAFSLFANWFGKGEYAGVSANAQMFKPYGRVAVMHVVILVGGVLSEALGAPVMALALLVALKTAMDLRAHARSHRAASPA